MTPKVHSYRGARIAGLVLFLLLAACESTPDLSAPKQYDDSAITFSYPGNWNADVGPAEDVGDIVVRTITIETPGDAIFTVSSFTPPTGVTVQSFATEVESSRSEEIKQMLGDFSAAAEVSKSKVSKRTKAGAVDGVRHDFAIKMLGETVPHYGDFFQFDGQGAQVITYAQAAHEDWVKVEPGFEHIYASMKVK